MSTIDRLPSGVSPEDIQEVTEGLQEYRDIQDEIAHEGKRPEIPSELVGSRDFGEKVGQDHQEEIYTWYAAAIARRGREPLSAGGFISQNFV